MSDTINVRCIDSEDPRQVLMDQATSHRDAIVEAVIVAVFLSDGTIEIETAGGDIRLYACAFAVQGHVTKHRVLR